MKLDRYFFIKWSFNLFLKFNDNLLLKKARLEFMKDPGIEHKPN